MDELKAMLLLMEKDYQISIENGDTDAYFEDGVLYMTKLVLQDLHLVEREVDTYKQTIRNQRHLLIILFTALIIVGIFK